MIAERVAAIFGVTLDEIKQATTRNAAAVFVTDHLRIADKPVDFR